MSVVDGSFGNPLELEEEASAPLAGGVMNRGFQCGMLWGASLAAGAEAYRHFGSGPSAEAKTIMTSERLAETFRDRTQNEINCTEITEVDFQDMKGFMPILKYFVRGGKIGPGACFRLAAGYAKDTIDALDIAFPAEPIERPPQPVSCAAELGKKMGATEMHVVMASGFAGGIGLSGGACGALGAAIWLTAMNSPQEGASKLGYFNNPVYLAVIDKFEESTEGKFECCEIVGRKFESIDDHAQYLQDGGCKEIIEALASL